MIHQKSLEVCKAYLNCQCQCAEDAARKNQVRQQHPFVTISRATGAGGITVGERLAQFLNEHDHEATCSWTVFDKDLVQTVLKEHNLPDFIGRYMPEDKKSEVEDFFEELFNLHPSEWSLVHKVSETIMHLAQMGECILVGRGANIITRKLPYGFHVRLTGTLKYRVHHIQAYYQMGYEEALRFVQNEDRGRKEYFKKHFAKEIDDPLFYDLTINTDSISYHFAARLIGKAVLDRRFQNKEEEAIEN